MSAQPNNNMVNEWLPSWKVLIYSIISAARTHQFGFLTDNLAQAAFASALLAANPKQVAPEPDMRTAEKQGSCLNAASTVVISGRMD